MARFGNFGERLLIVWGLWLTLIATGAFAAPTAPTVYVAGDGTGDFNCDGADDQVEINQALSYVVNNAGAGFTTVYLKGPRVYVISNTVKIGNNTTMTGDSTACIKLKDHANWATEVPMVTMMATGNHDIKIHGFEIDGNDTNNYDAYDSTGAPRWRGHNWYNILAFRSVTRLEVYNMYLHDNMNDALSVNSCSYVQYHDNRILRHGHDGLQTYKCSFVTAYNNIITNRTNCGIRFSESNHCEAYGNDISTASGGSCAIQIQRSYTAVMDDIKVHDNVLHTSAGPGIWQFCNQSSTYTEDKARNVRIYNNIFYNCKGGVRTCGFFNTIIENNVFDSCGSYGISQSASSTTYDPPSSMSGFTTIVRNNIISGNTYGIQNSRSATDSVSSSYNCFNGNTSDFSGSSITTANELLNVDPLFVNRSGRDYHLQSKGGHWNGSGWTMDSATSPCVDAGYPQSVFSLEPQPNGGRINIGAYGNTAQASKSGVRNALCNWGAWAWVE